MPFDVASELKAKIAKENDEDHRTTLMLLLGVFEANLAGIEVLSKKIDALRGDEQSLRMAVLNGHEGVHHEHHEWITKRIEAEAENEKEAKADKRAARDALIRQGVVVLLTVATTIIGTVWVIK